MTSLYCYKYSFQLSSAEYYFSLFSGRVANWVTSPCDITLTRLGQDKIAAILRVIVKKMLPFDFNFSATFPHGPN